MLDFLGGNQPRPTTILPGQWIFELPSSDTQIHIHRFRQPADLDQAGPSNFRDILSDPFERAWRRFNDSSEEELSIVNNLESPCVIISQEVVDERNEKILWLFTTSEDGIQGIEGLEEILPHLQPLSIPQLISCQKHGQQISCLDTQPLGSKSSCQVALDTSEDTNRHLELLTSALVEKMAWRKGNRIVMDPALTNTPTSLNATLRPISSLKLLLSIQPCSSPSTSSTIKPTPLILSPLNLPAVHISHSFPTSTQIHHLSSAFESALGHSWKTGRSEARTQAQLSGETYSDWSIYWVPLTSLPSSKGKLTPRQLIEKWQSSQGVLTIWPTHLSQPYFNHTSSRSKKPIINPTQTKSSDLLDISTKLFDFLSTYKEPEPPEENEEDQEEEEDINMDAESTIITAEPEIENNSQINQDEKENDEADKSDLDDLFSENAHSPTPVPDQPIIQTEFNTPIEPISIDDMIQPSTITIENRQPSRNGTNVTVGTNGQENGQKEELVTEDDFAFFDSPTAETGENEFDGINESIMNSEIAQIQQVDERMELDQQPEEQSLEDVQPVVPVLDTTESAQIGSSPIVPIDQEDSLPVPLPVIDGDLGQPFNAELAEPQAVTSLSVEPITATSIQAPSEPPAAPVPPNWYTTDLIPPSFSPLPLLPLADSPFPYSLPTPAPTPSDLNWDLVERLQPPKPTSLTYANDWKMDEEISDIDDQESYTGPPTPESSYTSEDEEETKVEPKKITEGHEIEFEGNRCIGSEWIYLIYEIEKLRDLAKIWNPSWSKEMLILPPTPPHEVEIKKWAKGIDLTRFAKELIGNRALRELYDLSNSSASEVSTLKTGSLMFEEGITLSDLSKDSTTRALSQPPISAGYHNYSINLSIPSLQYWSELGLQPHGGYKDVEAVVLCEDSSEAMAKGREAVGGMKTVWEELHLGKHNIAVVSGATEGVISASTSTFSEAVANVTNLSQDNMVLYILLPPASTISSSLIKSLYNISLSPSSAVIHLLPQHALTPSHYRNIAFEVYNKISEPIQETSARLIPDPFNPQPTSSDQKQVTRQLFTLARTETPIPEFSMSWPLKSYDVLNNNRYVHSCYTINEDLGIMIAFIIDDNGELFEVNIWNDIEKVKWDNRIDKVFKWIKSKADEWLIEPKASVIRVGKMFGDELKSWRKRLKDSQISFTLITTESSSSSHQINTEIPRPRGFANIPLTTLNDPSSQITDLSLSAQLTTLPSVRIPIDLEDNKVVETIYPISSLIITNSTLEGYQSRLYNIIHHNSSKNNNKEIEYELGEEIHRITCLVSSRWGINDGFQGLLDVVLFGLESLSENKNDDS